MIKRILIFLLITVLIVGCANLPTRVADTISQGAIAQSGASDGSSIDVDISLLQPLAAGESILLAVLDVVSGAWIAPQFIPVTKVDELTYHAALPVDDLAMVRYKYIKVGSEQVEEINSAGESFVYRTLDPKSVGHIADVISGWEGGTAPNSSGRLVGTIKSSASDKPLGGLSVEVQGRISKTDAFGRYEISGLPDGEYYVRFIGSNQGYIDHQQLAVIADNSVTVADVWLEEQTLIDVVFSLTVHEELKTDSAIYVIGDISTLGYYAIGSYEAEPHTDIKLDKVSDSKYQAKVKLPAGSVVRYKYTLGDGFWGSERSLDEEIMTRTFIVPATAYEVSDSVASWGGPLKRINVNVPSDTPVNQSIYLQLNAFEWSNPIQLIYDGNGGYFVELAQPIDIVSEAQAKFYFGTMNGIVEGFFDDAETVAISFSSSDPIELVITDWDGEYPKPYVSDFSAGPPQSDQPEVGFSFKLFKSGSDFLRTANTQVLPASRGQVMVVELTASNVDDGLRFATDYIGMTIGDPELQAGLRIIRDNGLTPWLYLDNSVSISFVDRLFLSGEIGGLNRFSDQLNEQLINMAQVANLSGVETIVIGGAGLEEFTPGAFPPEQAAEVWNDAIANLREHFDGRIYYSARYNNLGLKGLPGIDLDVDGYMIDWTAGTGVNEGQTVEELASNIHLMLEYDIIPSIPLGKRIILRVHVPSNAGVIFGCANDDMINCAATDGVVEVVDTTAQALVYRAFMTALSARDDIEGFISGGFDPLASWVDRSSNVYHKPAFTDINKWISNNNP